MVWIDHHFASRSDVDCVLGVEEVVHHDLIGGNLSRGGLLVILSIKLTYDSWSERGLTRQYLLVRSGSCLLRAKNVGIVIVRDLVAERRIKVTSRLIATRRVTL